MNISYLVQLLITNNIKDNIRNEYEILDNDEILKIIRNKLNINRINDLLNFDTESTYSTESLCCARVWRKSIKIGDTIHNFKKVDSRCSFKATKTIDNYVYCEKHYKQLKNKGYLRLLRYDEKCPNRDIINYDNGNYSYGKNRIWYDNFSKQLEILLKFHNHELDKLALR